MMRHFLVFYVIFILSQTIAIVNGRINDVKLEHSSFYEPDVFGTRDDVPKVYQPHLQLNDASNEFYKDLNSRRTINEKNKVLSSYIPGLTQQIFKDINDGKHDLTRADIPVHPDEQYVIPEVDLQNPEEGLSSVERIYGYFKPPQDGDYVFKISSEGESTFSISTSSDNSALQKYADVESGQFVPRKQYDKFANQKSEILPMQAGKMYYLEVIHKRIDGPSHLQLGAVFPDKTRHYPVESKYFFSAKEGNNEPKNIEKSEEGEKDIFQSKSIVNVEKTPKDLDVRQTLDKLDDKLVPLKCGPKVRFYSTNYKCSKRSGHTCKYGVSADDSILRLNARDSSTLFTILKPGLNNYADSASFQVNGKHGFFLLKDGEKFIVAPNDGSKEFASLSSFSIENGDDLQPSSYLIKLFNTKEDYVCHNHGSPEILTDKKSGNCAFFIVPDELDMNAFEPSCKDFCERNENDHKNGATNLEALPEVLNDLAHHSENEKVEKNSPNILKALGEHAINIETLGYNVKEKAKEHRNKFPEEHHSLDDIKTRLNVERIDPSRIPQEEDRFKELLSVSDMKSRLLARIDAEKNEQSQSLSQTTMKTGGGELKQKLLHRINTEKNEESKSLTYNSGLKSGGQPCLTDKSGLSCPPPAQSGMDDPKTSISDQLGLNSPPPAPSGMDDSKTSVSDQLGLNSLPPAPSGIDDSKTSVSDQLGLNNPPSVPSGIDESKASVSDQVGLNNPLQAQSGIDASKTSLSDQLGLKSPPPVKSDMDESKTSLSDQLGLNSPPPAQSGKPGLGCPPPAQSGTDESKTSLTDKPGLSCPPPAQIDADESKTGLSSPSPSQSETGQKMLDRINSSPLGVSEPSNIMMPASATHPNSPTLQNALREKLLAKIKEEQVADAASDNTNTAASSSQSTEKPASSCGKLVGSKEKPSEKPSDEQKQECQPAVLSIPTEVSKDSKEKNNGKPSNLQFITVHFQNEVGTSGDVRIISSIKPTGYLLGSDIFKLKLVFKYKYVKKVKFYGKDESGQERNVLLNGQSSVSLYPVDNQKEHETIVVTVGKPGENTDSNNNKNSNNDNSENNNDYSIGTPKVEGNSKVISGVARNKLPQITVEPDRMKDPKDDLILDNHGPMEHLQRPHASHLSDESSFNDVPDVVEIAYDDDNAQKKTITEIHVGKDFIDHDESLKNHKNDTSIKEIIRNITEAALTEKLLAMKSKMNSATTNEHLASTLLKSQENLTIPHLETKSSLEKTVNDTNDLHKGNNGSHTSRAHHTHAGVLNNTENKTEPTEKTAIAKNYSSTQPETSNLHANTSYSNKINQSDAENSTKEDVQDRKLFEKLSEPGKHHKGRKSDSISLEKIQAEINKLDEASAALQASNLPRDRDNQDYTGGKPQKKTFTSLKKLQSPVVEEGDDVVVEKKNVMTTIHALEENTYRAKQKSLDNFLREYTNEDEGQKERYRAWVARHQHPNEWYNPLPVNGVKRSPVRTFFYQPFSPTDPVVVHEDNFGKDWKRFDMAQNAYRPIQFHDDKRAKIPHHRQHGHKRIKRNACQCDAICAAQEDEDACMFDCENMCDVSGKVGKKYKVRTRRSLDINRNKGFEKRSMPYQYGQPYTTRYNTNVLNNFSPNLRFNIPPRYSPNVRSDIPPRYYWKLVYPTEPQYQQYRRWLQPTKWYRPVFNDRVTRYYINQRPTTASSYYMPMYQKTAPLFYARNGVPSSPNDVKGKTPEAKKEIVPRGKFRTHNNRIVTDVKLIRDDEPATKKSFKSRKNNVQHLHKFSKTVNGNRRTLTPRKTSIYSWHPVGFTRYAKIYQHSMPIVYKRNITMNRPFAPSNSQTQVNTTSLTDNKNSTLFQSNHTENENMNATQKLNKYKAALLALMAKSGVPVYKHKNISFDEKPNAVEVKNATVTTASKEQLAELQQTFDQLNPDNTTNAGHNDTSELQSNITIPSESKSRIVKDDDSETKDSSSSPGENKSRIVNKIMNDDHKDGKRNNSYFAIEIAEDENSELKEKHEEENNGVARTKTSALQEAKTEIENEEEAEKEKEREKAHESINNILFDNDVSSVFYSDIRNLHRRLKNSTSGLLKQHEKTLSAMGKGYVNHTASTSSAAYPEISETDKEKKLSGTGLNSITPTKPFLIKSSPKVNKSSTENHEENKVLNEGDITPDASFTNKPSAIHQPTSEMHGVDSPTLKKYVPSHHDMHGVDVPALNTFAQTSADENPTGKQNTTPKVRRIQKTTPPENRHPGNNTILNAVDVKGKNKTFLNEKFHHNKTANESIHTHKLSVEKVSEKLHTPKEIEAVYTDRIDDTIYPKVDQSNYEEQLYKPYNNHDTVNGDWFDTGFHPDTRTKQDIKMSKSGFLDKLLIRQKIRLEKAKLKKVYPTTKLLEDKIKNIVKAAEITENSELQNLITDSIGTALSEEQQSNALNIKNAFHNISDLTQQDVDSENSFVKPVKGDNSEIAKIMADYNDELSLQEKESPSLGDAEAKGDIMHQMDIHDQQEINALKYDLAGSVNQKVKSQMMSNFTDDAGFEEYGEKKRFHTLHRPDNPKRKFFINADITTLSKNNGESIAAQVSDAITETGNPIYPTVKENFRKHRLAKNKENNKENKDFEGIKAKWKKVKEQNKHIAEQQREGLKEDENEDSSSKKSDSETQNALNSYFTEVEDKSKLSTKGSKAMNDRQLKRQRKIKETLAMINDIENQIDGMIHSSDHQVNNVAHAIKAHKKGKTAVYNELVGSGEEEREEAEDTHKAEETNHNKKLQKVTHDTRMEQQQVDREELEDNDDKSENIDEDTTPKPTDDYIENAREEVEDNEAPPPKHKKLHHKRKHIHHQHAVKKTPEDPSIASVIASGDRRVRQQQASELLNLQNEEVNDDLVKLKEVTQDGLQSMFAKAVAKQQKFMDDIQGPPDDEGQEDVTARDQLHDNQYNQEKLESYLGDQTLPYSNNNQADLRDISPNEIDSTPPQEISNDEELPSNRKSDVEREEYDEDTLDNDNEPQEESDEEYDDDDRRRRRRTVWNNSVLNTGTVME